MSWDRWSIDSQYHVRTNQNHMERKKMCSNSYLDGSIKLPKDVIQTILMCLPLRDAVRTSILSRAWRFEWSSLPRLIFNWRDHFKLTGPENQEEFNRRFVKIVDQVLLLHHGPIYKFKLFFLLNSSADIGRWILFLSRNGIKKLTLGLHCSASYYKVPSCLFSCEDITYLRLFRCKFNLPPSFNGFSKLREMRLQHVDITEDGLRILISLCMHLKKLTLRKIVGCTRFKLCAKELVSFSIDCNVEDLHFDSNPLLADVCLDLSYITSDPSVASIKSSRIVEVLGCLPSIERLKLVEFTLQDLAVGDIPASLPMVCPLKQLSIEIDFDDVQQLLAAFCIFRSSPLLQRLTIEACYNEFRYDISAGDFWQEVDFNCKFTHLLTAEVTIGNGSTSELKFIEYIAGNAPLLERLQIEFTDDITDESKVFRELLRFRRCSTKAEIIVLV